MCLQTIRSVRFLAISLTALALSTNARTAEAQAVDIADEARANRDKLAAEIAAVDGDALRSRLLKSADKRLAHWYAGEVLVEGQWLNLKAAEQHAAADKNMSAYRELRQQATDSAKSHEKLARWCQKRKLTELAEMHWLHVVRFEPQHKAALGELGLRWHNGLLLSHAEADSYQEREREWLKEKKAWQAKVKRLRRNIEKGQPEAKVAAREELREIKEPAAVPALLEEFAEPATTEELTNARRTELMTVLGGIDSPAAVETLAHFAVESPEKTIRYAAIDQLKSKPLETYVPALLAGMAQPIEASVCFNEVGNRIVSSYSYTQEGPGDYVYEKQSTSYRTVPGAKYLRPFVSGGITRSRSSSYRGCGSPPPPPPSNSLGSGTRLSNAAVLNPAYEGNKQRTISQSRAQAEQQGNQVVDQNTAIQRQNERLAAVLTEVTGETLSAFPKSWWNWWGDYLDQNPSVATVGTRQQLNRVLMNQQSRGLARGTWVWTLQGKLPVEKVLPGDFVLAQEPRTGELAYQVVLAIATPQTLAVSEVKFNGSELHCAPGHVVWSAGSGWQHVSKLKAGQSLHGAITEHRVAKVDPAFELDSYDLIVDGFHTFFVGEQGVLVHDATPIGPTHVALPGFSPAAVADAAQLAANLP